MNRAKQNTWRIIQGKEPLKPVAGILKDLKQAVDTYEACHGVKDYNDELIINDMMYALGMAINKKYMCMAGFELFKDRLIKQFEEERK